MAKLNAGKLVGGLADGDRPILQPFEERALRLQRDAVDLVEQNHFGRGERPELGDELARRRVDHLKADDLGRLQVGASLDARELRVADGGEDDAKERLAHARNAAQQQVAGVDLPFLILVVGRRDFRQQNDVGQRLFGLVANERLARLGDDRLVQVDGLLKLRMHCDALYVGRVMDRDATLTRKAPFYIRAIRSDAAFARAPRSLCLNSLPRINVDGGQEIIQKQGMVIIVSSMGGIA